MVAVISLLYVIGTMGALELGDIGIGQATIRSVIGLIVFYYSSKKYWTYNEKETTTRKVTRFNF